MVSDGTLENFGSNIIHVHSSSLQPLQTLQSFSYPSLTSSGRHSPTSSAAAAAAAAYNASDSYPYHGSGGNKLHQESHHAYSRNSTSSNQLDSNLYNKIEVIPSYKSALHGATAQVYSAIQSTSPSTSIYGDHTATLYSVSNPNQGTTITYNSSDASGGNNTSLSGGIVIGSSTQYSIFIDFLFLTDRNLMLM